MNAFGIPGHGGALGTCAYCGEGFLVEIMFGKKIVHFKAMGTLLAAHKHCSAKYGKVTDWRDLCKGPLREAAMRADEQFFAQQYATPINLPIL